MDFLTLSITVGIIYGVLWFFDSFFKVRLLPDCVYLFTLTVRSHFFFIFKHT